MNPIRISRDKTNLRDFYITFGQNETGGMCLGLPVEVTDQHIDSIMFYLVDDKKDRSIQYWRSLPEWEAQNKIGELMEKFLQRS